MKKRRRNGKIKAKERQINYKRSAKKGKEKEKEDERKARKGKEREKGMAGSTTQEKQR
jgi:hypothetical protein